MKRERKVPRRRFREFQNEGVWEQRKLDYVASFSKGRGYSKNDLLEDGTPIILYGRLYTNYETSIKEVDTFVNAKNGSIYSKGGEVIVPASGETAEDIARASSVEKAGILLGGDLNVIIPVLEMDSAFLALSISNGKPQQELAKKAQGKSVVHIHNQDIKELNIPFTSKQEQEKISKFFSYIDKIITINQRKLEKLKALKKAYLSQMFPSDGESKPKLRFAGFNDEWEINKLGKCAGYRRGSFPQPYGKKEWYGGEESMPFVQIVDVTNNLTLAENTKQKISKLAQPFSIFVNKGAVIVTLQGSIGRVAITQYDAYFDRTILIFDNYKYDINNYFWAYVVQRKFDLEKRKAPGGTIKTITKEALSDFAISLPNKKEQNKIASFLSIMDNLINLHQRKLEKLQNLKKAYLNEMFV